MDQQAQLDRLTNAHRQTEFIFSVDSLAVFVQALAAISLREHMKILHALLGKGSTALMALTQVR